MATWWISSQSSPRWNKRGEASDPLDAVNKIAHTLKWEDWQIPNDIQFGFYSEKDHLDALVEQHARAIASIQALTGALVGDKSKKEKVRGKKSKFRFRVKRGNLKDLG